MCDPRDNTLFERRLQSVHILWQLWQCVSDPLTLRCFFGRGPDRFARLHRRNHSTAYVWRWSHPAEEGRSAMARKKSGLGLLGWVAVIVLVLLVLAYLQQRGMVHLPVKLP